MGDIKFTDVIIATNVRNAIEEAQLKHGPLTRDPERAVVILLEEVGELAREILESTRPRNTPLSRELARQQAVKEAAQVAATAIRLIANLEMEGE